MGKIKISSIYNSVKGMNFLKLRDERNLFHKISKSFKEAIRELEL